MRGAAQSTRAPAARPSHTLHTHWRDTVLSYHCSALTSHVFT